MIIENPKRIMSEKKTRLLSLRNQNWKAVQVETEKINESSTHISAKNITELNEPIYAGAKLVSDKISVPKEHDQKLKTWMWDSTGNPDKKSTTKMMRQRRNAGICWDEKKKRPNK